MTIGQFPVKNKYTYCINENVLTFNAETMKTIWGGDSMYNLENNFEVSQIDNI